MDQKMIVLQGLPASGKTSYALSLQRQNPGIYKRICPAQIRKMLNADHFDRGNEAEIRHYSRFLIKDSLDQGYSVIIDACNLKKEQLSFYQSILEEIKAKSGKQIAFEKIFLDIPISECVQRDALRKEGVGMASIRMQYNRSDIPEYKSTLTYSSQDESLPNAVISDLDGTLAIIDHRNPYDASSCEKDIINEPVARLVQSEKESGSKIILVSGRSSKYRQQTERWLEQSNIVYDDLIMREEGDFRKDSIVKEEFYNDRIRDRYFVKYILDDRDQVVEMWRKKLQLPCFQINYGPF